MSQMWWYVARSTGIVAWALGIASVLWGTALATKALGRRPRPAWLLDLHRFLGGGTVLFVVLHVLALIADSYVQFDVTDVLVPFASTWKPGAVALGVLALWALLVVEVTSLLRRRLPKRVWRGIHLTSYGIAVLTSVHLLTAGTDAGNPVLRVASLAWIPLVVAMLVYRALQAGEAAPRRIPERRPTTGADRLAPARPRVSSRPAAHPVPPVRPSLPQAQTPHVAPVPQPANARQAF